MPKSRLTHGKSASHQGALVAGYHYLVKFDSHVHSPVWFVESCSAYFYTGTEDYTGSPSKCSSTTMKEVNRNFKALITQGTFSSTDVKKRVSKYLQLGLALSLLEDRLHLGRLHDVALDLELAAHEQTLSVGLASHEGGEVCVREGEGDCSTITHISIDR